MFQNYDNKTTKYTLSAIKMQLVLFIISLCCIINVHAQYVGVGTDNPQEFFSVGASSQFRVNASGDVVRINNVQYSFPASNSSGTLVNNGSGTLSWTNAPTLAVTNFTGTLPALNGSNLTNLNASNIASGTVSTARLGSGTADATTFLRGDGSWQTPAGGGGSSSSLTTTAVNAGNIGTSYSDFSGDISIPAGKHVVTVTANTQKDGGAAIFQIYNTSNSTIYASQVAGITGTALPGDAGVSLATIIEGPVTVRLRAVGPGTRAVYSGTIRLLLVP